MSLNIHNVSFVKSAASAADFIRAPRPSVVFAGKSNVGKSSVINRLLCRLGNDRVILEAFHLFVILEELLLSIAGVD